MRKYYQTIQRLWDKNRNLILRLILPLLALAILSMILSYPFTRKDIFINLGTDFIIIIITIWYVNWILNIHEKNKWLGVEEFISSEAGKVAHGFISIIADQLKLSDKIFPSLGSGSIQQVQTQIIENVKELDQEMIIDSLKRFNALQWNDLMESIEEKIADSSSLLIQFGSRIDPSGVECILKFREAASRIISSYSIFKLFLGVPREMLPKVKGGKPWEFTILATIRTGIDLEYTLARALDIIEIFNYEVSEPDIDYSGETEKEWENWWVS